MAVIYNEIGNAGNIAFMHGHFEAIPAQQAKATEAVTNFIELRNNRYYLKHGAIWPSKQSYKELQLWELLCLAQCVIYSPCLLQYVLQVQPVSNLLSYEHRAISVRCTPPKPFQWLLHGFEYQSRQILLQVRRLHHKFHSFCS